MYVKLLVVLATGFVLQGCRANSLIDPNEVDKDGYFDARTGAANATGVIAARSVFEAGADLLGLDKRQECAAYYGTCPGGTQCACPSTAGCCGSICYDQENTCCPGYICPPGWGCCRPTDGTTANNCYPDGAQCCFDGRYCPGGSSCTRVNGYSYARCRVYGSTDADPDDTYSEITTPTSGGSPTPTANLDVNVDEYALYTVTYTISWWYYYYTATTISIRTTYYSYSTVTYTRTSTELYLSTSATDSYAAYTLLSESAYDIESETSSSAESVGTSMSEAARSSYSSITESIYNDLPVTTNGWYGGAAPTGSDGIGNGGGGAPGAASTNIRVADKLFFLFSSAIVATVAGLMLYL